MNHKIKDQALQQTKQTEQYYVFLSLRINSFQGKFSVLYFGTNGLAEVFL